MRQVGSEVASAAGTAESREGGLLRVQWGWERGREVDVGQVGQGTPSVVSSRDQGCSVFLVGRWKDARKRSDIGDELLNCGCQFPRSYDGSGKGFAKTVITTTTTKTLAGTK